MFKVDFIDGEAVTWTKRNGKAEAERFPDYRPRFYVSGDRSKLQKSRTWLTGLPGVEATRFEEWRPGLEGEMQKVLRVDASSEDSLRSTVHRLKKEVGRSEFRYYNVGFSPQFRFCLQNEVNPVPDEGLERIDLELPRRFITSEDLSELRIDGENPENPVEAARKAFRRRDPDIVLVNRGQVLRLLSERVDLSRTGSFQKLADENTVSSYGKRVHSAARYNVPGRIVIDRSNSFLLGEATLQGLWDLVERSYRPLQELAWGSIGRLLTSIEVKKAFLEEDTLTPWKNWRGERPKKASTLHAADRGGFIFNPEPSIHRDVYEADYASLFPNIMIKKNISPETVCCSCCSNDRVPELDYSICENRRGFISRVLRPLVEDRQEMKKRLRNEELSSEEERFLQGSVDAIKWILVSCFGYMGHAHASYGAIRCHQAIQAFDREIMLNTKEMFEDRGFSVVHGIIDSIWVQGGEGFEQACEDISREVGIELEPEHRFDWVAFVPRSGGEADIATLNRYFGKTGDGFKYAGIETEQRSTPEFIVEAQKKMIKALDRRMEPEDVLDVLKQRIREL